MLQYFFSLSILVRRVSVYLFAKYVCLLHGIISIRYYATNDMSFLFPTNCHTNQLDFHSIFCASSGFNFFSHGIRMNFFLSAPALSVANEVHQMDSPLYRYMYFKSEPELEQGVNSL